MAISITIVACSSNGTYTPLCLYKEASFIDSPINIEKERRINKIFDEYEVNQIYLDALERHNEVVLKITLPGINPDTGSLSAREKEEALRDAYKSKPSLKSLCPVFHAIDGDRISRSKMVSAAANRAINILEKKYNRPVTFSDIREGKRCGYVDLTREAVTIISQILQAEMLTIASCVTLGADASRVTQ